MLTTVFDRREVVLCKHNYLPRLFEHAFMLAVCKPLTCNNWSLLVYVCVPVCVCVFVCVCMYVCVCVCVCVLAELA